MNMETKSFFVADEIAEILQIPRHAVYRLVREGRLGALRVGPRCIRVSRESLQQFLSAAREPSGRDRRSG